MKIGDAGYQTEIEIAPHSRQTSSIPLEFLKNAEGKRKVDIATVGSIVLARSFANRGVEFYLMRVWLE
jgi:hypothetical protein